MSGGKFSRTVVAPRASISTTESALPTHEGGQGYERDAKSELFLLAASNMVGEQTFYESGDDRDNRFVSLIQAVARDDPAWVAAFIPYLRDVMQMRSASIVAAVECCRAMEQGQRTRVVASALSRADEPGEMLAYWHTHYGRSVPSWLKRGIDLRLVQLYTERSFLKYSGQKQAWSFGDVIVRTHACPADPQLWRFLVLARYNRGEHAWAWLREQPSDILPMLHAMDTLNSIPQEDRAAAFQSGTVSAEALAAAGMTWERLSSWIGGPMDATAWSTVLPSMGYMATLRNLRNFEDAGISEDAMQGVAARIANPEEVRASRQFPLRFLSAYKNLRSERFSRALEQALEISVENIPVVHGRTLILIDCSGSMDSHLSDRSTVKYREVAGVFGLALAKRCEHADVYAFGTSHVPVNVGGPVLRGVAQLSMMGATNTWQTLAATFAGHDRVVILTDEQAHPSYGVQPLPVPRLYTFNLAGYKAAHTEQGKNGSYAFGGLTDAAFSMLHLLEQGQDARWPFVDSF